MNNLPIDQIDVINLFDTLGVEYTDRGKNVSDNWIGVQCPFCDDTSNHLGVNTQSKLISCFKCGKKGSILHYLSEYLYSYQKAITIIEKAIPRELKSFIQEKINNHVDKVIFPEGLVTQPLSKHTKYLESRGYKAKRMYNKYGFHSVGVFNNNNWDNRIIVPIYRFGRLVTYTSIHIEKESNLRYKHLAEELSIMHCKQVLYNEQNCNRRSVIVVEGLFDVFRLGDGAVCTFGTKVTAEQKMLLSKYEEVKICFDGDADGRKAGQKLADDLSAFTKVTILYLEEGLDPDKLSKKQIKTIKEM